MAKRIKGNNGQSLIMGLEAYVGTIEMKAQLRIKPQRRIAPHDQEQFVKRRGEAARTCKAGWSDQEEAAVSRVVPQLF
jgi:hypothetical protein